MCMGQGLSWESLEPSLPLWTESWSRALGQGCAGQGLLGSPGEIAGKELSLDLPSCRLPLLQD